MRPIQMIISLLFSCAFAFAFKAGVVPMPDQIIKSTGLFGGNSSNGSSVNMRGGNPGAISMRGTPQPAPEPVTISMPRLK